MPTSPCLSAPTLSTAIAERLRDHLLQGQWAPGQSISDAKIAQQLGVSRTPVREALRLLRHEGLLTTSAHGKLSVPVLRPDQVQEAQQLHALLRAHVAQHGHVHGGLASAMLRMVHQRLQLAPIDPQPASCSAASPGNF